MGYGDGLYGDPPDALYDATTGGLGVVAGGPAGGQVVMAGQVQYGDLLMGTSTSAGWRDLVGWRDTPDAAPSDTPRPQAHGAYPGDVFGDSLTVTYTYMLRGLPQVKLAALRTLERYLTLDGVERPLVVDDGDGPTLRFARVIQRTIPMDKAFRHAPLECSVQWLCADPLRYSLGPVAATVALASSAGGLAYPLGYPLAYGTSTGGGQTVVNDGSAATPAQVAINGPLTNPLVTCDRGWRMGFDLTLVAGETLLVDAAAGTALLNGNADRLYTINPMSSPLELCKLAPGQNTLALVAAAGSGSATLTYRHAYL